MNDYKNRCFINHSAEYGYKLALKELFGEENLVGKEEEKTSVKNFKPGDRVIILSEHGNPESIIRSVLGNGNYYLMDRYCEYPGISLMSLEDWNNLLTK